MKRHTNAHRCPVCGGADGDPRHQARRCAGFTSEDGYVHCSREELAGAIQPNEAGLYAHRLGLPCNCGETHEGAPPETSVRASTKRIVATYDYRDESSKLLFQVLRYEPKAFKQRKPNGAGGWEWKLEDVRRVLYRLPELIASDTSKIVYFAEGEKDVDCLVRHGFVATTAPHGAEHAGRKHWREAVADLARKVLTDRDVVVIADADAPGRTFAAMIAKGLASAARSIRVLECPRGKDVSGLYGLAGTVEDLVPVQAAPVQVPARSTETPTVLQSDADDAWRKLLLTKRVKNRETGEWFDVVLANVSNAITILRFHPRWRGVLALNEFAERIEMRLPPPWHPASAAEVTEVGPLRETDTARVVDWLARNENLAMAAQVVEQAIPVVAEANSFHPVREYLRSLEWDRVERLPTWLSVYCGTKQSPYSAAIGTRWMISAVARPFEPGCQVDCMLVLEGPQGAGKSSAFRALVPDPALYSETGVTIGDKDSYQCLHGIWIYMQDELDSMRRGETTKVKNFLTSPKDHYRPSYGRVARDFYRQNVFAGTTNEGRYLVDRTGNRRIWPERVTRKIDVGAIERDRDQLWAEAFERFAAGEKWHVDTPELRALCEAEQAERVQGDPWEEFISDWLAAPYERSVDARGLATRAAFDAANGVTTAEVLVHALEKRRSDITRADEMRVAEALRSLGYEQGPRLREGGDRVRRYQKVGPVGTAGWVTSNTEKTASESQPSQPSQPHSRAYVREPAAVPDMHVRNHAGRQDADPGWPGWDRDTHEPDFADDVRELGIGVAE